jgi:protein-L-isoaspartate(D-aspartate) O-methyltransferase
MANATLDHARTRALALLRRRLTDERVIQAMAEVPRENFVPSDLRDYAYDDRALPIGHAQTISQPLMVGLMLQAAEIGPGDKVLDVGSGSGYGAAVMSRLAKNVIAVERVAELLAESRRRLQVGSYTNVAVHSALDVLGWPAEAPYNVIIVGAGAPHLPRSLLDQLAPGGRLVIPVGNGREQELVRATKVRHGVELTRHGPCAFVPLVGAEAWEISELARFD